MMKYFMPVQATQTQQLSPPHPPKPKYIYVEIEDHCIPEYPVTPKEAEIFCIEDEELWLKLP